MIAFFVGLIVGAVLGVGSLVAWVFSGAPRV